MLLVDGALRCCSLFAACCLISVVYCSMFAAVVLSVMCCSLLDVGS